MICLPSSQPSRIVQRLSLGFSLCLLLGAPGCAPYPFEWTGPSPYFAKSLDMNRDGEVARVEWEVLRWDTNLSDRTGWVDGFDYADCDSNGRLSWHEYYEVNFKVRHCEGGGRLLAQSRSGLARYSGEYLSPLIITGLAKRQVLARDNRQLLLQLQRLPRLVPADIVEAPLPGETRTGIHFRCDPSSPQELNLEIGTVKSGTYPAINCDLENTSSVASITMVLLTATELFDGRPQVSWHVKSIWVPPGNTETLSLYFPSGATPVEVQLQEVRGMPSG